MCKKDKNAYATFGNKKVKPMIPLRHVCQPQKASYDDVARGRVPSRSHTTTVTSSVHMTIVFDDEHLVRQLKEAMSARDAPNVRKHSVSNLEC